MLKVLKRFLTCNSIPRQTQPNVKANKDVSTCARIEIAYVYCNLFILKYGQSLGCSCRTEYNINCISQKMFGYAAVTNNPQILKILEQDDLGVPHIICRLNVARVGVALLSWGPG